jgi:hypothetical protein
VGDQGRVGRTRTGSIRILAGFWGVIGILMLPSGLATGRWWILLSAALIVAGSAMLWWACGQKILPEGPASGDMAFQRANRLRLIAVLVTFAGIAVAVIGFRMSAGL